MVQRYLPARVGQRRVRIGRHDQERLRPQATRPHARDLAKELVAAQPERPEDPWREWVGCQMSSWVSHRVDRASRLSFSRRALVVEQPADEPADAAALSLRGATCALRTGRMEVAALQSAAASPRDAVDDEVACACTA